MLHSSTPRNQKMESLAQNPSLTRIYKPKFKNRLKLYESRGLKTSGASTSYKLLHQNTFSFPIIIRYESLKADKLFIKGSKILFYFLEQETVRMTWMILLYITIEMVIVIFC